MDIKEVVAEPLTGILIGILCGAFLWVVVLSTIWFVMR
jgi:hypothetical protein